MNKLCAIFSVPSHYREGIYKQIDNEYDCQWHFTDEDAGVKRLDLSLLKETHLHKYKKISNRLYLIKGIQRLLSSTEYKNYLVINGPICPSIWLFLLRARLFYPRKRIYLWGHGWYGKETRIERIIKGLLLRLSHGIFVYGEYAKKIAGQYGCNTDKIHVIHNSLNYDEQLAIRSSLKDTGIYQEHFNNDLPTLLFIGRLTKVKKLNQILEAVKLLRNKTEFYNIVFVGDGPEREYLVSLTDQFNLRDNVWFFGESFDEKVNAQLIYNADLCVSPGNVGLTGVHSMMFGTPVITHNNFKWQMPEFEVIKDGETGSFFAQDDIEDLAGTISEWFHNMKGNRNDIRQRCFNMIDGDWNPYAQIEVVKSVIK